MKHLLSLLLFFLPTLLWAQDIDSTAIRQVDSLIQVSRTLTGQRQYEQALAVNAEAERLALAGWGRESAVYGRCCFNRGRVFYYKGDKTNAEKWYLESSGIYEKTVGKEHPEYAWSLHNLGLLYKTMGYYEQAESLYLEAKAIREKVLGKEHADYATSVANLANLYYAMGNYEKAEPLHLEAKAIREKVLGREHPHYAHSLNNLAIHYYEMGNYEKAEPLYLEAIAIREKVLGKEHPDYASGIENLAILYHDMGNFEKVEPLYLEAKAIREKVLGKEHPDYATSLNNLAVFYDDMGSYEKAEPLYLEAKSIWEKALGKENLDYVSAPNNLANLYYEMGNYEKVEPLHLEAKAIREKVLGKEHPDYVASLENLIRLYERQSRFLDSEPLQEEAFKLSQTRAENATSFLSEYELAKYITKFRKSGFDLSAYLLARMNAEAQPGILPALAYDHALLYKGFIMSAASRLNSSALTSPETAEINLRLKAYRRLLAAEYAKPIADRNGVAELEEEANLAEKELTRSVAGYAEAKRQVKWQDVKAVLKPSTAAIEMVHFKVYFPQNTDSIMYAALLLLPGSSQPTFISLFEEKQLDSLLQTRGERRADYVNNLYAIADRGAKPLGHPKKSLYELLWRPLEKELAGVQTIYYAPSGLLHRLNLGAIPVPPSPGGGQEAEDETLSDHYQLVEMGSTRQLVVPHPSVHSENTAMLFGGIQYEMDSIAMAQANLSLGSDVLLASRGSLSFANADSTLRGGAWSYLKWTDKEVTALEPILKTAGIQAGVRKGFSATEESFKAMGTGRPSPRVLHIATHGYFFPDPKTSPPNPLSGGEGEPTFRLSDHPMLRSGLVLAGGNAAWQGAITLEGREDGILTAYEISQMNLSNTELVVLSACETGLGDIQGNEGVYGLQRAFKIAGAKYLIMSLWQVPDQETSVFMTTFYKHWLTDKQPIPDAFRTTQQEMRERFINPYQWAGFVLVE